MDLSVVVPTLNGKEQLAATLSALTEHAPDAEVIVVNGPSTDGTTGMVRERSDVDVLVEVADRTVNAARNAGIERATGSAIALVNQGLSITEEWPTAIERGLSGAAVVTGPTMERLRGGLATESVETRTIAGRDVTYFNPGNAAFRGSALDEPDGFDEYLEVGGARDLAHRLAALEFSVVWEPGMNVTSEFEPDGGMRETDWSWKYRSLSYRLAKNYGPRPTVALRLARHAVEDGATSLAEVARGEAEPSQWFHTGWKVVSNTTAGLKDGVWARTLDRTRRRNPRGRSSRAERAIELYDWR
jgi:glycosyltransferase involved in cell wall biosynthesis